MNLMSQNRELVSAIEQVRADTMRQIEHVNDKNRMLESQLEFTKTNLTTTRVEADSLRVCLLSYSYAPSLRILTRL